MVRVFAFFVLGACLVVELAAALNHKLGELS